MMKTVLVPVDLSSGSNVVVNTGCRLATASQAKLLLLHVAQPVPVHLGGVGFAVNTVRGMVRALERRAARRLASIGRRCERTGLTVEVRQQSGDPAATILALAKSAHAGAIVLGSHGHTAAYDLLVGSTTQHVLRFARVPVVVVPLAPARGRRSRARR